MNLLSETLRDANLSMGLMERRVLYVKKYILIVFSFLQTWTKVPDEVVWPRYTRIMHLKESSLFIFQLLWYLIPTISCFPFYFLNKKLKLKAGLVQEKRYRGPELGQWALFLKQPFISASLISKAYLSKTLLLWLGCFYLSHFIKGVKWKVFWNSNLALIFQ